MRAEKEGFRVLHMSSCLQKAKGKSLSYLRVEEFLHVLGPNLACRPQLGDLDVEIHALYVITFHSHACGKPY